MEMYPCVLGEQKELLENQYDVAQSCEKINMINYSLASRVAFFT